MIRALASRAAIRLLAIALLVTVPAWRCPAASEAGPNIVLITIDTLRADHLPVYGYRRNTAPFLAALASKAMVFNRAYSTSSWTAPATASLLTSTYPFQHNVLLGRRAGVERHERDGRSVMSRIPRPLTTLAEALRQQGYRTFAVSDNPTVNEPGFGRGFDRFEALANSGADRVNAQLATWEPLITGGGKYFLYIHYMDPHEPYQAREPWYAANRAAGDAEMIAAYDSEISFVDRHIADLYRQFGWGSDAILIVTADHGEEFGEHGGRGHGHTLFNEVLRVPLLAVLGAGAPAGTVDTPVSLVDVFPTVAALAAVPPSPQVRGSSLLAHAGTRPDGEARPLYAHLATDRETRRCIVRGDWKYLIGPGGEALYDLAHDGGEHSDVIAGHGDTATALRAEMARIEASSPTYEAEYYEMPRSDADRERLRVLGY